LHVINAGPGFDWTAGVRIRKIQLLSQEIAMDTMILVHESHGRAFTLPAARAERRLRVVEGQAWITRTRRAGDAQPSDDLWLGPGQTLELPAGSAWVVQAVGELRLRLCEPALSAGAAPAAWVRAAAWLRALRPGHQPAL
jgi:hypothetical protein